MAEYSEEANGRGAMNNGLEQKSELDKVDAAGYVTPAAKRS